MMDSLPKNAGPPSQRETTNAANALLERLNATIAEVYWKCWNALLGQVHWLVTLRDNAFYLGTS
jgi:hypothetical protein